MGKTTWGKAIFLGKSDPSGFQQGTTYTVQIQWPGAIYAYRVVSQEVGDAATEEYVDKAAIQAEWQFDFSQKGGPDT